MESTCLMYLNLSIAENKRRDNPLIDSTYKRSPTSRTIVIKVGSSFCCSRWYSWSIPWFTWVCDGLFISIIGFSMLVVILRKVGIFSLEIMLIVLIEVFKCFACWWLTSWNIQTMYIYYVEIMSLLKWMMMEVSVKNVYNSIQKVYIKIFNNCLIVFLL